MLALCGPGEIENLVTGLEAGICVAPDDIDAIDEALRDLWDQHEQDRLPRVKASLERFHRRELTRQLTACFDEVIG